MLKRALTSVPPVELLAEKSRTHRGNGDYEARGATWVKILGNEREKMVAPRYVYGLFQPLIESGLIPLAE
jgi:hypothetical protein